jgi:hypothetical protein
MSDKKIDKGDSVFLYLVNLLLYPYLKSRRLIASLAVTLLSASQGFSVKFK